MKDGFGHEEMVYDHFVKRYLTGEPSVSCRKWKESDADGQCSSRVTRNFGCLSNQKDTNKILSLVMSTAEEKKEFTCAKCGKTGTGFSRCSRCKEVHYCGRPCQQAHWGTHKTECVRPEDKPKPLDEEIVAGFVECDTFQECRDYLQKYPQLISKEFGSRFIRNAQILQYLLDLRKISSGQQDITLFFARILDPQNPEYRNNFTQEYSTLVNRIVKRHKELAEEKRQKKLAEGGKENASAEADEE
ncbi:hypothetical protein PROFUN_12442 [Planoprotostelium fungivorum]|uniref:MYND-type domain-containing protein n=1 Tax=Planoprotostelium fungivorum TaxID=1890364 RepID=A0A2P6N5S1_9EUKA|nr:hypothetical protein PROFUN_12442 [Planoprotostelium fungivorum]